MGKLTPDEAINELEKARQLVWDIQKDNPDAEIEKTVLSMDALFRKEQDKWEAKKERSSPTGEGGDICNTR